MSTQKEGYIISSSTYPGPNDRVFGLRTMGTMALLFGWGVHCSDLQAHRRWEQNDLVHNINWLELKAVRLALLSFQDILEDQHVLVRMDNVTVKAHINHQGRTWSRSLMQESDLLFQWTEQHLKSISAEHLSGGRKFTSGLVESTVFGPSRVVPPSGGVRTDSTEVGHTVNGLVCLASQSQSSKVLFKASMSGRTVTLTRWVSELAALSVRDEVCIFQKDSVVVKLDPTFLPKGSNKRSVCCT
ncbi:T-cell acute lymphocytic leukemia protein 2 isoform X1 [Hemicordylus capensis]|uniref:T-cell acute lymphocytic leukemia protein 2 isoform X1 n=1 Tax=Hemicordylus capensis TaxID=884348 RepID=UPI002303202C|nr:T-cell acute lymphocytic leukemia protein 2 isoform X1 [Hemicordylus capensis]